MRVQPVIGADEEGHPCALYKPDNDGTHVVLPLDPALYDDLMVEKMARGWRGEFGMPMFTPNLSFEKRAMRAALSALLAHLAEVE